MFMLLSILLLIITIGIYTKYEKKLLTSSNTKILRHYSFALILAFVFMIVSQFLGKIDMAEGFCSFNGKASMANINSFGNALK